MYPTTTVPHGFNHQSFYRQPMSNLRQINNVVWNQNNEMQQTNNANLNGYSMNPNHPTQTYPNITVGNTPANHVAASLPPSFSRNNPTLQQFRPTNLTSDTYQNRNLVRQSSVGALPESRNVSSREATPLHNSRSVNAIHEQIQRERRSHTMAPMSRITGPSLLVTGNMFARTLAPSDARALNASETAQVQPNVPENVYLQSETHKTDVINNGNIEDDTEDEEEVEDEDDDDDAPIIVKVRYDPDAGGPPSEDVIRQAIDNQLKGQSSPKLVGEPIVLNFLNNTQVPNDQVAVKPLQPVYNRSNPSIPQQFNQSQQHIPLPPRPQIKQQNLSSLQQRHQQHQQFLQQQQRQQQEQLQQQQRLQQQQQRQQQQQLQQQLQQKKIEQQILEQQKLEQQRLQQQKFEQQRLQQQKQEQQRQQQQQQQQSRLIEKQQKEKQQLQQYLQQAQRENNYKTAQQRTQRLVQLDNQRIRQQVKSEQHEINRLITQQLQQERQQRDQQKYSQLFQQQRTRSQQPPQRRPPIHQQPQQQHQYASLPPMGPRPSRSLSAVRPIPGNQTLSNSQQNSNIYLPQQFPSAVPPSRNPQYNPNIHTSTSNIPINPANNSFFSGPGLYASLSHQNLIQPFVPIQSNRYTQQQYPLTSNRSLPDLSQTMKQRPHTAPSSTELFRTPSALDIPELSKENLSSMLGNIPDLRGRQFNIEYIEPKEPVNIPIPSQTDGDNGKYPEAVIVDQLPNNLLQHVNSSNNLELKTVLGLNTEPTKNVSTKEPSSHASSKLKDSVSNVLRHKARPKHNVKDCRITTSDESNDTLDTSPSSSSSSSSLSSGEETEIEETIIENFLYPLKTN